MNHSKALINQRHELILGHIKDPDNSPLPVEQQVILERLISISKLLARYPNIKMVINLHKSKFPEISESTAYRDLHLSRQVYTNLHEFDYDFWKAWIINDIVANIEDCKSKSNDTVAHKKVIAMEHANLLKAVGEKPEESDDPHRNEERAFYIMVNLDNKDVKIDLDNLHNLPVGTVRELNQLIKSRTKINEQDEQNKSYR
jgi:hypothetical protein